MLPVTEVENHPAPGQPGYTEWKSGVAIKKLEELLKELAELNPDFKYNVIRIRIKRFPNK